MNYQQYNKKTQNNYNQISYIGPHARKKQCTASDKTILHSHREYNTVISPVNI